MHVTISRYLSWSLSELNMKCRVYSINFDAYCFSLCIYSFHFCLKFLMSILKLNYTIKNVWNWYLQPFTESLLLDLLKIWSFEISWIPTMNGVNTPFLLLHLNYKSRSIRIRWKPSSHNLKSDLYSSFYKWIIQILQIR